MKATLAHEKHSKSAIHTLLWHPVLRCIFSGGADGQGSSSRFFGFSLLCCEDQTDRSLLSLV
jgi:hypothetical protein